MSDIYHFPLAIFVAALVVQGCGAFLGYELRRRSRAVGEVEHSDFSTILGATLTLLALIIGFTFSMAVSRYDARKDLEGAEANAIGAEYARSGLIRVAPVDLIDLAHAMGSAQASSSRSASASG